MNKPPEDTDRIDDAVLALLFYGSWKEKGLPAALARRAWKSFDWDATNRLYDKGLIHDPVGKAKSLWLTEEGAKRGEAVFDALFRHQSERFATASLPARPSAIAPDGTDVRVLPGLSGASFAHFELAPGKISNPVAHRTVEEIWYFVGGQGEFWRQQGDIEEIVPVERGVCLTIPLGTRFQFRSFGDEPLAAVVVTMPPWPGGDEAYQVTGPWTPTVGG